MIKTTGEMQKRQESFANNSNINCQFQQEKITPNKPKQSLTAI